MWLMTPSMLTNVELMTFPMTWPPIIRVRIVRCTPPQWRTASTANRRLIDGPVAQTGTRAAKTTRYRACMFFGARAPSGGGGGGGRAGPRARPDGPRPPRRPARARGAPGAGRPPHRGPVGRAPTGRPGRHAVGQGHPAAQGTGAGGAGRPAVGR